MPDDVSNFARTSAQATDEWDAASPLEAYALTYSTGDGARDVRVTVGQWSSEAETLTQYNALTKHLDGHELASGNVKVNGANAGAYVVVDDADDGDATAIWRNDTMCAQMTGPKASVETVFKLFPL